MREKIKKFSKSIRIFFAYTDSLANENSTFFLYKFVRFQFCFTERFNESRFKSRKVKGRATSSENRKFFVAVMEGTLCHCDSRYVGRTSQRLEERIKQHVPKSITNPRTSANRQSLSRSCKNNIRPQQFHESAIGQHNKQKMIIL